MQTVNDNTATRLSVRVHMNANRGRFNFITDTANKFSAVSRFKKQLVGITWVDTHHIQVTIL